MEGIGSEVSHKIRAAIKAKLIELGAYVDDELPDYIMVMVANKRTRAQMDEDLHLFLSSNTKIFTSWLHTVLQKLQEVTVASFEKKDSDSKKSSKRKKVDGEDVRSRKSSEEGLEKGRKRTKKHKEVKKAKKNKYKNKEKTKSKKSEKEGLKEKSGKEEEKKAVEDCEKNDKTKSKKVQLNEVVGKAILGDLKKNKKTKGDNQESSSQSSSSSDDESHLDKKSSKENGNGEGANREILRSARSETHESFLVAGSSKQQLQGTDEKVLLKSIEKGNNKDESQKNRKEVIEDEFNIEPLKPSEKDNEMKSLNIEETNVTKGMEPAPQVEKTISAPTEELLKQHDKIQNEQLKGEENPTQQKKPMSDSEESLSPEEIRKQLLLSRAKKKLEESKKAERMRSNSPDVLIVEETYALGGRQKDLLSASSRQPDVRSTRSTHSGEKESSRPGSFRRSRPSTLHSDRSQGSERSPGRRNSSGQKPKDTKTSNEERKRVSLSRSGRNTAPAGKESEKKDTGGEKKRNTIRISETIEKERSLGMKKETERKTKEKEVSRKRSVSSRVVTIAAPEAPEIPSIVKVKPREFIAKDKQANKALILKAVADAEKSIATLPTRPEIVPEVKKEALYTKKLREKRYEKLAITLSNIRRSPDSRDRMVSVDSEKSDKSRPKRDSSDVSEGARVKSDLLSKKVSKSEDQFISSKTSVMEKNDKYIRCWLEGVEKAVKDEEMLNPSEMDDFVHSNPTDEENDASGKDEKRRKRKAGDATVDLSAKALKLSEKEIANLRMIPDTGVNQEGPQIVVTLDGLDTKAIKDLILKNKESTGKPLLSSGKRAEKDSGAAKEKSPSESKKSGFEKISDRFGRLNKVNEEEVAKKEMKSSKREASDAEKKVKVGTESKNRQLIAQLSEKFGKIDREFESRKRKRPDEDRRYPYDSRRSEKEDGDRNGRYRKSDRRSFREGGFGFYRRS